MKEIYVVAEWGTGWDNPERNIILVTISEAIAKAACEALKREVNGWGIEPEIETVPFVDSWDDLETLIRKALK